MTEAEIDFYDPCNLCYILLLTIVLLLVNDPCALIKGAWTKSRRSTLLKKCIQNWKLKLPA